MAMQETGEVSLVEFLAAKSDSGGACAPPFRAVGRLSPPLNASLACRKGLSIRRREVLKVFKGATTSPIRNTTFNVRWFYSHLTFFICNYMILFTKCFEVMKKLPIFAVVKSQI